MPPPRSAFATDIDRQDQRGLALVLSLMVLFVLMAMATLTISTALSHQAVAKTATEVDRAYLVAEAGFDHALFELQLGTDLAADGIGIASGTLIGGSYAATLTPAFSGPGQYTVQCTGTVAGVSRTIEAVVAPPPAALGFFAVELLTMGGDLIDSYDASLGPYATQVVGTHAGAAAQVGSNGNVELSGTPEVWGDVIPGPTGIVVGDTSGVSGSTVPAASPQTVDPYTYAPPLASAGSYTGTGTLSTGTYRFDDVNVGGGEVLTFDGDVVLYVDGKFTISGSGQGVLTTGSNVVIHHGSGDFTVSGNGVLNADQMPANLSLQSASVKKITVSGSGAFHGAVYAPTADVIVSGSGGIFGSVVGKKINVSGGAKLHQDMALSTGGGTGFVVVMMRSVLP